MFLKSVSSTDQMSDSISLVYIVGLLSISHIFNVCRALIFVFSASIWLLLTYINALAKNQICLSIDTFSKLYPASLNGFKNFEITFSIGSEKIPSTTLTESRF